MIFDVDVETIYGDDPDQFLDEFDINDEVAVQEFAEQWVDGQTGASMDNYVMLDDIQLAD